MRPLFSKHPALWRAIAGLAAGVALEALLLVLAGVPFLWNITLALGMPVLAMQSVLSRLASPESFVFVLVPMFFYPVIGAVVGFLSAEKQTTNVILIEGILAALLLVLWAYGTFIFYSWE